MAKSGYGLKKRLRRKLSDIAKRYDSMNALFRCLLLLLNRLKYYRYRLYPINDKRLVFESFMGRKYADSPKAIYEYILSNKEYAEYEFIWFFKGKDLLKKYEFLNDNERTRVLQYGSKDYYKAYATAKYWITNSRIPDAILKKEGQIYVQCWHGTPLKQLGFDISAKGENALYTLKALQHKYRVDSLKYSYMVSPSAFCTEKFVSAFDLKSVGRENIIIEEGYPRNDFLVNHSEEDVSRIKENLNLPPEKKIVLYAPTWRDNQHHSGVGYFFKNELDMDKLRNAIGNEYVILFRAHYFISNKFDFGAYGRFVYDVSGYDDINELYIISDILITDYSSVFFDYANLRRPIIFYMYDLEEYREQIRGFYISLDELPGVIVENENALIEEIKKTDGFAPDEKYLAFNDKYNYLDDGSATERVVNKIVKTGANCI